MSDAAEDPGALLTRWLRSRGWFQKNLAEAAGLTDRQLSKVMTGQAPLTPEVAVRLERATGLGAETLMMLYVKVAVARARLALGEET